MDFLAEVSVLNPSTFNYHYWRLTYRSGPVGALALILTIIGMPSGFPHQKKPRLTTEPSVLTWQNFRRVDFPGLILLLGASILFVAALEEGGTQYSWTSPVTLTLLLVAIAFWFLFGAWERYQEKRETVREPIFPWRLATDRFAAGVFLEVDYSVLIV